MTYANVERFDGTASRYIREACKAELLSAEEEKNLSRCVAEGDRRARDRMILSNLRLVIFIAKRYMNRGLPFLDLIEEGNLGLIKAVDRFKFSKECRFSTYGSWWIRSFIEKAINRQPYTVTPSKRVAYEISKMLRLTRELVIKLNREPSVREVAARMEVSTTYIRRLMLLQNRTYSMEMPMGEYSDFCLGNNLEDTSVISPEELMENTSVFKAACSRFNSLSEREQKVLVLRFGLDGKEPQTFEAIGQSFGLTRERIRQIEVQSLIKLRTLIEGNMQG